MAKKFQVDTGGTLLAGLIGGCPMEGNSNDIWVPSNTGIDTNVTFGTSSGKVNQGGSFNGSSSSSVLSSNIIIAGLSAWSVSAWAYLPSLPSAFKRILSNAGSSGDNFILRISSGNKWQWLTQGGVSGATITSASDASTAVWVHLIGTYDGSNIHLYINNVEEGTGTSCTGSFTNATPHPMAIGTSVGGEFWNGYLDELYWWNKCLSSTERSDLNNGGNGNSLIYVPDRNIKLNQAVKRASFY